MQCWVGWTTSRQDGQEEMDGRAFEYVWSGEKTLKSSYDGNPSENITRVNATSTFHFNDTDRGVALAI